MLTNNQTNFKKPCGPLKWLSTLFQNTRTCWDVWLSIIHRKMKVQVDIKNKLKKGAQYTHWRLPLTGGLQPPSGYKWWYHMGVNLKQYSEGQLTESERRLSSTAHFLSVCCWVVMTEGLVTGGEAIRQSWSHRYSQVQRAVLIHCQT